jgi:hypothetical protein
MLLKIVVQLLVALILAAGLYAMYFQRRERRPMPATFPLENAGFIESSVRVALSLDVLRGHVAPRGLAPGIDAALAVSQEDIARLAGLSNYRTREALKLLEQRGVLRLERIGLTILDPQALTSAASRAPSRACT